MISDSVIHILKKPSVYPLDVELVGESETRGPNYTTVAALPGGEGSFLNKEESIEVKGKIREVAIFKIYKEL